MIGERRDDARLVCLASLLLMSLVAATHPLIVVPAVPLGFALWVALGGPRPRLITFLALGFSAGAWMASWMLAAPVVVELDLSPALGLRWAAELDALSLSLTLATAAICIYSAAVTSADQRVALAANLGFFGSALALFTTRDAYLFLSAYGVLLAALAVHAVALGLASARLHTYRFLVDQLLGLFCLSSVLTFCWYQSRLQTGFSGTDFARLRSLAWLSGEAQPLFVLTAIGVVALGALFPFHRAVARLWMHTSMATKLLLMVFLGAVGPLWLVRWLVGLFPDQTKSAALFLTGLVLCHLASLALKRTRSWSERVIHAALAFVGLLWLALLSFQGELISLVWVGMIHFLILGAALTDSHRPRKRALSWILTMAWIGLPGFVGFGLLSSSLSYHWDAYPWISALIAGFWMLIAVRLVLSTRMATPEVSDEMQPRRFESRRGVLIVAAVLLALMLSRSQEPLAAFFQPVTDFYLSDRYGSR